MPNSIRSIAFLAISTLPIGSAIANEDEHRQHDAHVHGISELNIAIEGRSLTLELRGPAANFLGFEHPPRTAEEQQNVKHAVEKLEQHKTLWQLSSNAKCEIASIDIDTGLENSHGDHDDHGDHGDHGDHDDHDDHDDHGDHGESKHFSFEAHYHFECKSAGKLSHIKTSLFETFPHNEKVTVQILTDTYQGMTNINKTSANIDLTPSH